MGGVLVDSCVLLDLITADPIWEAWSAQQLSQALAAGRVLINPLIYAEVAFAYDRIEAVDAVLPRHLYDYRPLPREAAFLAARAHADCRERGGVRAVILPDFLIGAHAVIEQVPLLTRDVRRYRQAFPGLELIAPS
jgi:predicted nucleic acid-binding protein